MSVHLDVDNKQATKQRREFTMPCLSVAWNSLWPETRCFDNLLTCCYSPERQWMMSKLGWVTRIPKHLSLLFRWSLNDLRDQWPKQPPLKRQRKQGKGWASHQGCEALVRCGGNRHVLPKDTPGEQRITKSIKKPIWILSQRHSTRVNTT